jgi:hypothetical protein
MARHLFIVDRRQPALFSYLARSFSAEPDVTVILDRRQGERGTPSDQATSSEPRPVERRLKAEISRDLSTLGYAFVRLG